MFRKLVLVFVIVAVIILGLVAGWYVWTRNKNSPRSGGFVETPLSKSLLTFNQDKSYGEIEAKVIKSPYISDSFGYVDILLLDGRPAKAIMELAVGFYGFSGLPKQNKTPGGIVYTRSFRAVTLEELQSLIVEGDKIKISFALTRGGYGLNCSDNLCNRMDDLVDFTKRYAENNRLVGEGGEILLGMVSQFELLENTSNE